MSTKTFGHHDLITIGFVVLEVMYIQSNSTYHTHKGTYKYTHKDTHKYTRIDTPTRYRYANNTSSLLFYFLRTRNEWNASMMPA